MRKAPVGRSDFPSGGMLKVCGASKLTMGEPFRWLQDPCQIKSSHVEAEDEGHILYATSKRAE